jgi:hypothetical protein
MLHYDPLFIYLGSLVELGKERTRVLAELGLLILVLLGARPRRENYSLCYYNT